MSEQTLVNMLSFKRPAGSKSERRFIAEYIVPLGVQQDACGNLIKRIGLAPILWSSHTDSVHSKGGYQSVKVVDDTASLRHPDKSRCLGADDVAGVYLMREMILAQRQGLYVFHRSEESGGIGSNYIANRTPELLRGIGFAVALDRRGTRDVITHQAGGRCCSDAFAKSLAGALGQRYAPSPEGIFTDTANYTGLIGECTNVSVGYENEHRATERLDVAHVARLREALLDFDCAELEYSREPGEVDADDWSFGWQDIDQTPTKHKEGDIVRLVRDYPAQVADILEEFGMSYSELADDIWQRGGMVRQ